MKSPVSSTAQLARQLGLSRWTVSRALNGHGGLDPATVKRVKEAARRAAFSPSVLGSGLRKGRTNLVGICLPDLVDYFLTEKITRLQETLQQRGLHPLIQIIPDPDGERNALARFAAMRCAGVVLIASRLQRTDASLRGLAAQAIPVIRIDPEQPCRENTVSTDRAQAVSDALRELHALGHRRVVVAGVQTTSSYGRQRVRGLRAACRALGWDFERQIRWLPLPDGRDDAAAGSAMAETLLAAPWWATAIIAVNDRVALGLMHTLQEAGLDVPSDVSLIGYDNADFTRHTRPPLATIDPQVELLISSASDLLQAMVEGNAARQRPILVRPVLVARDSMGPAPTRGQRKAAGTSTP